MSTRGLKWFCLVPLFFLACGESQRDPPAFSAEPENPFKLAQYQAGDESRIAMLVGDRLTDLTRLNGLLPAGLDRELPASLLELVHNYPQWRSRLYQLANLAASAQPPSDVLLDSAKMDFRAPLEYPWNLLNVAANYRQHAVEMGREGIQEYQLDAPYIFAKSPKACLIGTGQTVRLPPGRDQIDWEVELAVVIGKQARNVSRNDAFDYIFGYSLMLDISDRGDRGRTTPLYGTDWFSAKSNDTFAPLGPYLVPAEFVDDPQNLGIRLDVNGVNKQDHNTSYMVHDIPRLVEYITSIQTLEPGDIIATGTPPGVGAGREPREFLRSGDVITAEIEGICSITIAVE